MSITLPIPRDDEPWGVLAPLRPTTWGSLIPVVTGDAMSRALHGNAQELLGQVGRPPRHQGKQLLENQRLCRDRQNCLLHNASHCYVASGKLPACFVATDLPDGAQSLASFVALTWDEGRYVVVVEGGEFVL